ncbi:MAG TPA: hypothetical protein VEL74_19920 [Thermoanaerobaculia bacterium]|nr:hypothetical protein [Thermoanaerobaculia bacterium]
MPISFADVTLDWESILAALREHPDLLSILEAERLALETDLNLIRVLKSRQEAQAASRQELTQKIKAVRAHGVAQAIAIRAVAKGKIGYRNERLVHFKVAPVRSRRRAPKPEEVPQAE